MYTFQSSSTSTWSSHSRHMNDHFTVRKSQFVRYTCCRTCSGSGCSGVSCTTLKDLDRNILFIHHLHDLCIDSVREISCDLGIITDLAYQRFGNLTHRITQCGLPMDTQVTGYNVLPNTMSSLITSRLSPMTGISSLQNDNFPIDTRSRLPSSFKNVTSTGPFPVYNLKFFFCT